MAGSERWVLGKESQLLTSLVLKVLKRLVGIEIRLTGVTFAIAMCPISIDDPPQFAAKIPLMEEAIHADCRQPKVSFWCK